MFLLLLKVFFLFFLSLSPSPSLTPFPLLSDSQSRFGKFFVGDDAFNMTLVDLPCNLESFKTLDQQSFCKSADLHQVF